MHDLKWPRYPIDVLSVPLLHEILGNFGAGCRWVLEEEITEEHPLLIAQRALAAWNTHLDEDDVESRERFLKQARQLLDQQVYFANDVGGWPISFVQRVHGAPQSRHVLSGLMQSYGISVLIRAYLLTREKVFIDSAHRAIRAFELDILDGGVCAPIGEDGIFFEGIAVYPARHSLGSHILALFGLYDYVVVTGESEIEALIDSGLATLDAALEEFDATYWTYRDLASKRLASRPYHAVSVRLLKALAEYSGRASYVTVAACWEKYQRNVGSRLCYQAANLVAAGFERLLLPLLRRAVLGRSNEAEFISTERVCVPVVAFPSAGGVTGVLAGVAQVMEPRWRITYLTNLKGQDVEGLEVEEFGHGKVAAPWQFPNVWLYWLAGGRKLLKLLRMNPDMRLILPQDGICTAAFAALAGKISGARVVCMDHGNMTCFVNPDFQKEYEAVVMTQPWYMRGLNRLRASCYWLSLRVFAQLATPWIDHFLVAGDEVEEVYRRRFGVRASQITRYAYIVDVAHFNPPDRETRVKMRARQGIFDDAIVITLINRLAPEKGLDVALQGIALALSNLTPQVGKRVKVLIAGDGPLREQIKRDIQRYKLEAECVLWGEASPADVAMLLGISDIFLYSGTRGTNYSMAVLEAMAAGCAVVASIEPRSNARLLANGRGIAVAPGDVQEISAALTRLCRDLRLCHSMGQLARAYVAANHSAIRLERTLLRTSFYIPGLVKQEELADVDIAVTHKK